MAHAPGAAQPLGPYILLPKLGTWEDEHAASARMFSRYGPAYTRPPLPDDVDFVPAPPAEAPVAAPPQGPVAD
ncbi:hypothetical protein HYH03_014082 [Edaphochlamys debaryana]|uniref:Uncharacterized protein n=1 Tax=Edaphochlamys debaryana TaxID=47281 RepID=A0A836BSH3_9CHLO|nr:hypothetical protein HYH03_014082 [Edaphochlamys debaryana]|eukprot:KAG2487240.1 hypothetical protein HYH03_014082 [Edaphochlamys debaryana]